MPFFVTSCVNKKNFPIHNFYECSLVGKSNSGKSSLINALANKKIAHISKKPGKTKTLNFYDFDSFWLVDMPGYGYAKTDKNTRNFLEKMIEEYFLYREKVCGVIHICSLENVSEYDIEVKNYLSSRFDNYLLVLNKIDKFSKLKQDKALKEALKKLDLHEDKVLLISAKYKTNIGKILKNLSVWTAK